MRRGLSGIVCKCRRIQGASSRPLHSFPSPLRSTPTAEEEAKSRRRLTLFTDALNKNLVQAEKALAYSVSKGHMEKSVADLEKRGFIVENHPDSHSLFLKKSTSTGENVVIDFWREDDDRVSIVIEISRDDFPHYNLYFKCMGDENMLGLQALELAPAHLVVSGDRSGIYGYPFDRDVTEEMKYYMTKHLHSYGIDSNIAKFAIFFCDEKQKFAKIKLLIQAKNFINGISIAESYAEIRKMDPLGLLDDDAKGHHLTD